jgi:hypothetical protein
MVVIFLPKKQDKGHVDGCFLPKKHDKGHVDGLFFFPKSMIRDMLVLLLLFLLLLLLIG